VKEVRRGERGQMRARKSVGGSGGSPARKYEFCSAALPIAPAQPTDSLDDVVLGRGRRDGWMRRRDGSSSGSGGGSLPSGCSGAIASAAASAISGASCGRRCRRPGGCRTGGLDRSGSDWAAVRRPHAQAARVGGRTDRPRATGGGLGGRLRLVLLEEHAENRRQLVGDRRLLRRRLHGAAVEAQPPRVLARELPGGVERPHVEDVHLRGGAGRGGESTR